jgi:hypothetical protein
MKHHTGEQRTRSVAFWQGFASSFDLFGRTFIEVPDLSRGFERDREALAGDWRRVGNDLRKAMNQVARER